MGQEFFVPAGTDLAVKLLTTKMAHMCASFFDELCDILLSFLLFDP
jgi:hypothetical protein